MDLEHFPWSQTANRMLETVSPIYDKSYVGKWIFEVIGNEFDFVKEHFDELRFQSVPQTATWGLNYWEMLLKLPDQPSLSMEERRQRILGKLLNKAPMNPARVEQLVESATGYPATVVENVAPYTFSVNLFDVKEAGYHKALRELLQRVKPSHLSYLVSASFPVIAFENRERIRLAILFHMKVGNLSDYIYLDGRQNLDGSWLLATQDFRGVKLDSLRIPVRHKARQEIRLHGWREGVSVRNTEWSVLSALSFFIRHNNFEIDNMILDGRRSLDGTWNFDTAPGKGPAFRSLRIVMTLKNAFQVAGAGGFTFFMSLCNVVNQAELPSIRLRLHEQNRQRGSGKACLYCVKMKNRMEISAAITVDTVYYLDDQFYLDGSRKLNADIERSEI